MDDVKEILLRQLHSTNPEIRDAATEKLWRLWFGAAGPQEEHRLLRAERLVEMGEFRAAEEILNRVIEEHNDFAEAWNRRATLRFVWHRYAESIADCKIVVQLEPHHFGAWHGLGLGLMHLRRYPEAIHAFRRALEIQPFAQTNWELIGECLGKIN
ncbi:MAG: tetratricopeptide repeat protein [Chloroflexi bacterium]|nr:tetratricopeptide repeat protein [Chloroflexota bacterium]